MTGLFSHWLMSMSVSTRLAYIRKSKGLTQQALADATVCTSRRLSDTKLEPLSLLLKRLRRLRRLYALPLIH